MTPKDAEPDRNDGWGSLARALKLQDSRNSHDAILNEL
jgi:hypothetical protein